MEVLLDNLALSGRLVAYEWDVLPSGLMRPSGRIIEQRNKIVLAGRNLVKAFLSSQAANPNSITHFALGTGTTAPTSADAALQTEVFRNALSQTDDDQDGKLVLKYFLQSTEANGSTLGESGLFNAAAGGSMVARSLLSTPIEKTSSKAYTFIWTLNFNG